MEYLTKLKNKLSTKEIDLIKYGGFEHSEFEGDIREALTNNTFNDNYIFSSLPGFGKTTSLNNIADELGIELVKFDGSMGLFAFAADLASVLLKAPDDGSKIYCSVDDCDSLFDKKNLNTTKGIFDKKRRVLSYGMSMPPAYHMLDDIQREAIDAFKIPGRSGFRIPTDRFVFIVLTNKEFPTTGEVKKVSESKKEYKTDLNAIRRRTEYNELKFDGDVDWGYCAHVVMSRPVCEYIYPDVTLDQKIEMLRFTSRHWKDITDQNLSIFDKMTKVLVRSPQNYYDVWMSKYLDK